MSVVDRWLTLPMAEHLKSEAHLGIDLGRRLLSVPYQYALQTRHRARLNIDELLRYQLVSFDLFDTLLRRRIDPPNYLKGAVARYIARLAAAHGGITISAKEVQDCRDWVEHTLRQRSLDQGLDSECRHEELMTQVLAEVLRRPPSATELTQILDFELRMETRALGPNPELCALMAQVKAAGRRVIVASDMYLSGQQLQALMDAHGVPRPDKLYASSDLLLNKGSGRLFQHILASEKIAPEHLVHIGDNRGSDVTAPRRLGISVISYYDGREHVRRSLTARTLQRMQRGHRAGNTLPIELEQAFAPPSAVATSATYELGHQVLGPAYCVFLHRVMLRAEQLQLDQLHFVAREGFLLKQIYEVLQAEMHPLRRPVLHYTHLSRLSTALPQLVRFGIHQLPLNKELKHGATTVLQSYGIYDDELRAELQAAGLTVPTAAAAKWDDAALQSFLRTPALQPLITTRAHRAHDLLRRYLDGQGFFSHPRAALVDVGWSGTIQNNVARAFAADPSCPELYGFYLALVDQSPDMRQHLPPNSHKEGLLYDHRAGVPSVRDKAPHWFEEVFELAAQPPHGTTLGYTKHGDQVEAVLKAEAPAHDRARHAVAEIQRGILDYARVYGHYVELGNLSLERLSEEAKHGIADFIFHPSARMLEAVSEMLHTVDWGDDTASPLLGDDSLLGWLAQGRASWARFSGAMWKHGEVRRLGGPLLSQLYHLYTWYRY